MLEAERSLVGGSQATFQEDRCNAPQLQEGVDGAQNRRAYQNQRRQRWRARKKEEKRTKELGAEKDGNAGCSGHRGGLANAALHEFKRLGKAKEAELKLRLNKLASLSILPGGYSKHNEAVVALSDEIVLLLRGGRPSLAETANKILSWTPKAGRTWQLADSLTAHKVLEAFSAGQENSTSVHLTLPSEAFREPISLASFSQMHQAVYLELYIGHVSSIQQYLPMVLQNKAIGVTVKEEVTALIQGALICLFTMLVSRSSTFSRDREKAHPCSQKELAYIWNSLRVSKEKRCELLREWGKARTALLSHSAAQQRLEDELGALLEAHNEADETDDSSYVSIVSAVKRLGDSFEQEVAIRSGFEFHSWFQILTPFEFGILAAAQLPRLTVQQQLVDRGDPFVCLSNVLEAGVI